jgi:Flp pilus assembly protein TadG
MRSCIGTFAFSIGRMLKAFRDNQTGNTSIIFALAAIPMFLGAGAAIDMARVNEASTHFAAALDAAALAAAADTTGKTEAQLEILARAYLDNNYGDSDVKKILAFDLKSFPDRIEVTGTTRVKTTIMSLAQIDYVDLDLAAEVIKAGSSIEVSLVLDNTGSMATGTKMASLKAAAKNFVNTVVWTGSTPYYSKVAIVPYSMGVNVDTYAVAARGPITTSPATSTTPGSTNFRFTNMPGNSVTYAISNCVSERIGPKAYTDDAITTTTRVGRVYPPSSSCLSSKLLPLTNDKSVLNARIDAMSAAGSTAGHVGVAWGWYTLSPTIGLWSGSSIPAAYGTQKLKKIMILMTDAEYNTNYCNGVRSNTSTSGSGGNDTHINCSAPNGSSWTQAKALCAAMKQKGVEIYTIEFELDASIASRVDLIQSCATDSAHRFNAANEVQLNAAFQAIAMNLLDLRVAK